MKTKVVFFTAGTIGAGHVARGIAIERALGRSSSSVELTLVGPPCPFTIAQRSDYRAVPIDPMELYDRRRALESELAQTLSVLAPDVIVVDMFWAPVLHVLPRLSAEAWLLVRKVPEDWFDGPPGHRFDRAQYARVIGIEPGLTGVDETIDPVLLVRREEQRPRGSLRAELGLGDGDGLVVVQHAGVTNEHETLLERVTPPAHVFLLPRRGEAVPRSTSRATYHDGARFFPLAAWLADADEIVSGAGYNAYWETRLLGLDEKTRYVAFPRPLDDQAWRVEAHRGFVPAGNGADTLAAMLSR